MSKVVAVLAMNHNRVIGAGGEIPWRAPEDLKHFKRLTMGHVVIMGRATFDSVNKPFPGRTNVVISRTATEDDYLAGSAPDYCFSSLEEALEAFSDEPVVFIIGGAKLLQTALDLDVIDEFHLTLVDDYSDGDTFLPEFEHDFSEVESITLEGRPSVTFKHYIRK